MRKLLAVLSLAAVCGALTACNTVSGMGEDISSGGHAVTRGAENVKQNM